MFGLQVEKGGNEMVAAPGIQLDLSTWATARTETDVWTNGQIDQQTDRQTNRPTNRPTDRQPDGLRSPWQYS